MRVGRKAPFAVGDVIGHLRIVEFLGTHRKPSNHGNQRMWRCECLFKSEMCDGSIIASSSAISSGKTNKCAGCGTTNRVVFDKCPPHLKRSGYLTAVAEVGLNSGNNVVWRCVCDCGGETEILAQLVYNQKAVVCSRSCPLRRNRDIGMTPIMKVRRAAARARSRHSEWTLTDNEAIDLVVADCAYCGWNGPKTSEGLCYNGIDRIDSSRGYCIDNVASCCKICQEAKMDRTLAEFSRWLDAIHAHRCGGGGAWR